MVWFGNRVTSNVTTLEDWESATPFNAWSGDTDDSWTAQTGTVLDGSNTAELTTFAGTYSSIKKNTAGTSRGNTYRMDFQVSSTGPDILQYIGIQDTTLPDGDLPSDAYIVRINTSEPDIDMWKRTGGSLSVLDGTVVLGEMNAGETYTLEMDWSTTPSLQARVLDSDGTTHGETTDVSDSDHAGGVYGIGGVTSDGVARYYDKHEEEPLP